LATERIQPVGRPVVGAIRPPGSKSLTNRALVVAGLAVGESLLVGGLDSQDTRLMAEAWQKLGAHVEWRPGSGRAGEPARFSRRTTHPTRSGARPAGGGWATREQGAIKVLGTGGRLTPGPVEIFAGNAGTVMRFMTAAVALGQGPYLLDGVARMRERPIGDLLEALGRLGVAARSTRANGCPPVVVEAQGLPGGSVTVAGTVSSQYLSALLMAAPYAARDLEIRVSGELVSTPYADLTCRLMADFGVKVEYEPYRWFLVPAPQGYSGRCYAVEPDATAATYFWSAAALTGGAVTVLGLSSHSAQGDVGFVHVLEQMGCRVKESPAAGPDRPAALTVRGPKRLRGLEVDLNAMPDTALTLAVLALFAEGETVIRNVANLRVKETDRLAALAAELRKFGAEVEELDDGLRIEPPLKPRAARVKTYSDHRMAMSFALAGLKVRGVEIAGAECVRKTFPDYFDRLRGLVSGKPPKSV